MKATIDTQYSENYGAHAWDGEGECPQYWKQKGGTTYVVTDIPVGAIGSQTLDQITQAADAHFGIRKCTDYSYEFIMTTAFEEDNFIPYDEQLQMEFSGKVTHKSPTVTFKELGF
jgi:hypothetical protein